MKRSLLIAVLAIVASSIAGCAPASLCARVSYAAEKYKSRDAATLCVNKYPQYRFNTRLRSDLEDAMDLSALEDMKVQGAQVLTAAQTLAVHAACGEIDRMSREGIEFLGRYQPRDARAVDQHEQRATYKEAFSNESRIALEADLARLQAAGDLRNARRVLARIEVGIEAAVGDRGKVGRVLLTAPLFLPAAIGADIVDSMVTQQVIDASFDQVYLYSPLASGGAQSADQLMSADDEQLAEWFAPLFVQQTLSDAPYPPSEDQFGRVFLTGTPDNITVQIDIDHPTVYWSIQEAKIGTTKHEPTMLGRKVSSGLDLLGGLKKRKQIVYATWYPSRPALEPGDSEAGLIDGVVIRITLDRRNRPAVYEFVRSCGCYHMLYVAEFVEAAARRHFGDPLPGNKYALQKQATKRELFIPALVADDGSHPTRPVAYVSGGQHMLMGVEAGGRWSGDSKVMSERSYLLKRYETLTHLPLGDGVGSMFGSDGLVHNAGRAEGWLLAPTGMRSAGQPRQLGTMKIRMDAYDYDDPRLLDRQLRLSPDF